LKEKQAGLLLASVKSKIPFEMLKTRRMIRKQQRKKGVQKKKPPANLRATPKKQLSHEIT
jgi:hypothetical protein